MLINEGELVGYNRMSLNGFTRFVIRPTETIQLILGTNGSGKSSLMKELSPLPAEPKDYSKNGSKTITITHRGSTYVLKSWFSEGNKHSLLKNGEELNEGHTITVQRKLVEQEFGLTDDIHALMRNAEKFHEMSPLEKRKWFTRLSDVSYDYALGVFQRLKELSSQTSGALKMAKNKLVAETNKIATEEEEKKLTHEVEELYKQIEKLQKARAPIPRPVTTFMTAQEELLDELYQISDTLLRNRHLFFGWRGFDSVEDIANQIDEIKLSIASHQALLNKSVEEHNKLTEKQTLLKKTGAQGVESLLRRLHLAQENRNQVLSKRILQIEGFNSSDAQSALNSIYDLLFHVFSEIPQNEDGRFSQAKNKAVKDSILAYKDKILTKQKEIAHYQSKKQHMEAHKESGNIQCPKCHHMWIIGYDPDEISKFTTIVEERSADIAECELHIKELEEQVLAFENYVALYLDFSRCVKNWPALQPFWNHLLSAELVIKSPRVALKELEFLKQDLIHIADAAKYEDEINEIKLLIKQAEELGDANLSQVTEELEEKTKAVEQLTNRLVYLNSKLEEYTNYRKQMSEVQESGKKIEALISQSENATKELIEMLRREAIQNCINALQLSLARKSEALQEMKLQKGIIADLEKTIADYAMRDETLKLMVREMSPNDGLIAEGLLGFIRVFIKQMNSLIKKIWTYPLEVQVCGVATDRGAELDYKFPLLVQSKANMVDDIKNGSSGMQEVVDLAFKTTAMKHLGLSDFPLLLDEFSASFDAEHRVAASNCIKNLMETQGFSQLFMISHYESGYGSFTNAQVCVLDPRNITVPARYNEHVTMT